MPMPRQGDNNMTDLLQSDLWRIVWTIRGSTVGGSGLWANTEQPEDLEARAKELRSMFPQLWFDVEHYTKEIPL